MKNNREQNEKSYKNEIRSSFFSNCREWSKFVEQSIENDLISRSFYLRHSMRSLRRCKALFLLLSNIGSVVKKQDILNYVWGVDEVSVNNVTLLIYELRLELADQNVDILTVRKVGYILMPKEIPIINNLM